MRASTMSSETSTDSEPLQPWQLFTLAGLVGATAVVFVSGGQTPAAVILLSLTIFTAAAVGIAVWRTFAPFTHADDSSAPPALGGRSRAALEREKTLVLRSIKELEFDRAMGKVSDKDFTVLSAALRVRAAGLLRQLDSSTGYRGLIEKEIVRRVGGPVEVAQHEPAQGDGRREHAGPAKTVAEQASESVACPSCGTTSDPDARFCKSCGTRLQSTA